MRVCDLNELTSIDKSIQNIIKDLQELCQKRQSIIGDEPVEPKVNRAKRKKTPSINSIDLNSFDLTLASAQTTKRRRLF